MPGARIVHVIEQLRPGGPLHILVGASRCFPGATPPRQLLVSLLPADAHAGAELGRAGIALLSAPTQAELHAALAEADIVQLHFWNAPAMQALMASELPPMRVLGWCLVNGLHAPQVLPSALFEFADVVVATSEASMELPLFRAAGPERCAFILAGSGFERVAGVAPLAHEGVNVGYIGLLDFVKLHPAFVAMSAAVTARPLHFQVCGEGGSRRELERQVRELGAQDRFSFVGQVEDIRPWLSSFDVFGYPLCEDTYATSELALQEPMHAGVPPVVFAHGGVERLVRHGHNGLVVRDEAEYVRALERLCADPEERRRLGANAAVDARREFGAERTATKLQALYSRLLESPKRARAPTWTAAASASASERHSGARALLRSLDGMGDADLRASLEAPEAEALAAETRIAQLGPNFRNLILQYRLHYPADAQLRLWAGLLFAQADRRALAASEFKSCLDQGFDAPRVRDYLSSARQA